MDAYGAPGAAEISAIVMILGFFLLLPLVPGIFYLITLHKALARCRPRNRLMAPGLVWLMIIPFFNIIWHFVIVLNLAGSLGREFKERGVATEPEPGQSLGVAMCALVLCGAIPYLGLLTALAALVCWICYWVKIAEYSNQLAFQPWNKTPDPLERNQKTETGSTYRANLYANRRDRVAPEWR